MNCPSRTDEPPKSDGWNQSPPDFSGDLTTRQDFNGLVNLREQQDSHTGDCATECDKADVVDEGHARDRLPPSSSPCYGNPSRTHSTSEMVATPRRQSILSHESTDPQSPVSLNVVVKILVKFARFIGPGFMISVAYIDPGNYSTDVAAGAATRFRLLFIVLMSNVFAILLQSLAVRLGTVTGLNLAEHCRAHLPRWLNLSLYILGEAAIIATDIAEVSRCC